MTKFFEKDNRRYKAPIKIEDPVDLSGNVQSGMVLYTSDIKILSGYGYHEWVQPAVTIDDKIRESVAILNRECDNKILTGFTYHNDKIYLSMENQMNFANMYMAKEYLDYPQTIKTQDGYAQLANAAEVTNFYLLGISYVKQCLEECWAAKQAKEAEIRAEYEAALSGVTSGTNE